MSRSPADSLPFVATRRGFLAAAAAGTMLSLGGCSGGVSGRPTVTLYQSKPEAIPYFRELVAAFNAEGTGLRAVHDTASNLSGGFARSAPPDLGCLNYNFEMARFQERGALSDLSDLPEAAAVAPEIRGLVDQYPGYPGRTSVIPYSLMAASVLYNRELFDRCGVDVPRTWTELLEACGTFQDAGVTPLISTYADAWTVSQGLADYSLGGGLNIADFFAQLRAQGDDLGPTASVSFSKDFHGPLSKMLELAAYSNRNAASLGYGDGNLAFARGEGAMYLHGPWALGEIAKTNADLDIGTFPLPMTEDADDLKVRVNIDLALWIPEAARNPDGARELAAFLLDPAIQDTYNAENLGFGVRAGAPPVTDERLVEMQSYVDRGAFYQGASTAIPRTIPFENYMQGLVLGADLEGVLTTLDDDWARLARRS